MTIQEMRSSLQTLIEKDEELRRAYVFLDQTADWPINDTFNLLILMEELKKRMKDDVVHFTFKKKDGTVRQAYGTRESEIIVRHEGAVLPDDKSKRQVHNGNTFPYYDIERKAWRCFRMDMLMDIDRGYTI